MPSQYDAYGNEVELNCSRRTLGPESYYCNEELMQLLVFDARATNDSFTGEFHLSNLARNYKVFQRFVATQSGLTRWQPISDSRIYYGDIQFGDLYRRAVNEPWYKGAIFQHQEDPDSVCLGGNY